MLNPIPIHAAGIYQEDGDDDHIDNDFLFVFKNWASSRSILHALFKIFAIHDSSRFTNYIYCFSSKLCRHRTFKFINLTF